MTSNHVRKCKLPSVCGLCKCLGEHVHAVVFRGAVAVVNITDVNAFADEMVADVDVLRAGMELTVMHESDSGLIVAVEWCGIIQGNAKFNEQVTEPDSFLGGVREYEVFGFHS